RRRADRRRHHRCRPGRIALAAPGAPRRRAAHRERSDGEARLPLAPERGPGEDAHHHAQSERRGRAGDGRELTGAAPGGLTGRHLSVRGNARAYLISSCATASACSVTTAWLACAITTTVTRS